MGTRKHQRDMPGVELCPLDSSIGDKLSVNVGEIRRAFQVIKRPRKELHYFAVVCQCRIVQARDIAGVKVVVGRTTRSSPVYGVWAPTFRRVSGPFGGWAAQGPRTHFFRSRYPGCPYDKPSRLAGGAKWPFGTAPASIALQCQSEAKRETRVTRTRRVR